MTFSEEYGFPINGSNLPRKQVVTTPPRDQNKKNSTTHHNNSGKRKKSNTNDHETNDKFVNKVNYDSSNHWSVLTQMHGSIWPTVFPYCILNILNTILVVFLRENRYEIIDISFSDRGHTFMSMMVSFLMVTRSNIAYARYMEARQDLSNATIACRELISYATTFTRLDKSSRAKKWRIDLARRTIKLLRTMATVLEFQSKGNHAWKVPVLSREEKSALQAAVGKSNERSPMVLAMFVQTTIASHVEYLNKPLHPNKELKLYGLVSDFVQAYHGLMKLVTTPFPFPLVQMTRTFLFIWVFTLPWVLVNDLQKMSALLFTVFFITYAFVGLELVAIELDDPFGADDNDFDVLGLVTVTFKDIYIYIYDLHGNECRETKELLDFIHEANRKSVELDNHSVRKQEDENGRDSREVLRGSAKKSAVKPHHTRWDSLQAWELSACIPTVEAGSEHSKLLQNEKQKLNDQVEAAIDNSRSRKMYTELDDIVAESYSSLPSPPPSYPPPYPRQKKSNYYGTMGSKPKR